ncbi:MAG: DegV family EDD domain-containing protein [Thermoanaerobaculia bacterium]|nr:DegV family EDD domain-containing protein [Thermoanaerobaculia bacterium]
MRPAVLIVDQDDQRRRVLAEGLAKRGYEVVPTASAEEGLRFARGLGPSVIVGTEELPGFGDGSILESFAVRDPAKMRRILVVMGHRSDEPDLPDEVLYLRVDGLAQDEIQRRILLVLVGREIGVDADPALQYLVGDTALMPLLDLVRGLHRCLLTGLVQVADGFVAFRRGLPIHAQQSKIEGVKAFCRLSRASTGPFRVTVGPIDQAGRSVPQTIESDLEPLLVQALEEVHLELPDLRTRVRLSNLRDIPSGELTPHEAMLARVIHRCDTLGDVLDNLTATDALVLQAVEKMRERGALHLERPRSSVRVVTDSTSDMPPELLRQHDVEVVPLTVIFGGEALRDGVDIRARDFYRMLEESEHHPSTQAPPEEVFYEHFHDIIEEQDIVSVHISSKLSQATQNARSAAMRGIRSFDHLSPNRQGCALEVVDSSNVSVGLGLMVLFASRLAARGEGVFAIAQRIRDMAKRLHVLFAVDTLDFLVKGGRIGKAQAMVGKLLGIKPILGVVDGEVTAVDQARGGRRVHSRIVELLSAQVDPTRPIVMGIVHAQAPVWADRLARLMSTEFKISETVRSDIGPAVGTHTGPGCVGTVVFQPTPEEWELIRPLET